MTYRILRKFANSGRTYVLFWNQSLVLAQGYCKNPETSSLTCTSPEGRRRTRRSGPWFDCYEEEK